MATECPEFAVCFYTPVNTIISVQMALNPHEKELIRALVAANKMVATLGPGDSIGRIPHDIVQDPKIRYIIGHRDAEFDMEIRIAIGEEVSKPPELRGKVMPVKGIAPRVPETARAQPVDQAFTQMAIRGIERIPLEPLGTEPNSPHGVHPVLYDPRPESVEEWLRQNVPNPDACIAEYQKQLKASQSRLDPYRASWDALLKAVPASVRGEIVSFGGLEPAKNLLKEKMIRDALMKGLPPQIALRVLKPSMNLPEQYNKLFQDYFKKYRLNETAANLAIFERILKPLAKEEEWLIFKKVLRSEPTLHQIAYDHGLTKHKPGRPGGAGGGKMRKMRIGQRPIGGGAGRRGRPK